ncbi:MAG: FecR domain-containing protein, partial [Caldisericota bacterium]|nr:FecR domain-containing protein [Caldisericota bacterium]
MRISIFCWVMIVLLVLPASSAVAENAGDDKTGGDPFTGTWYGRLSGEGLRTIPKFGEFRTGFRMEFYDVKLRDVDLLLRGYCHDIAGSAIVRYSQPVFKGLGRCTFKLENRIVVGKISGPDAHLGRRTLYIDFRPFRPGGTYIYYPPKGPPMPPDEIKYNNFGFDLIPSSTNGGSAMGPVWMWSEGVPDKINVEVADGGETLRLRKNTSWNFKGLEAKWEIEGVLHKVDDESYDFPEEVPPDEKISTDKHTRKKVNIPGVGEVIAGPESEFKIESSSGGKTTLEQFKGDLMHRVKEVAEEGRSFEVLTPQCVSSVRGTTFLTSVREGETVVVVFDGSVEVSDKDGGNSLTVRKGQMVVVEEGTFP